jgi:GNAT superfamily N-acetyltransferase
LDRFSCGRPELDYWLRHHAWRSNRQGSARTYVWSDHDVVVAYYAIAPTMVQRAGLPRSASGGLSDVPAYLLARLALDQGLQTQGYGGFLLLDAIESICAAARIGGGRLIVADPIDQAAASFYEHFGFGRITGGRRMFLRVAAAQVLLDSD